MYGYLKTYLVNNKISIYYLLTCQLYTDFYRRPYVQIFVYILYLPLLSGVHFIVYAIFYQTNVYRNEVMAEYSAKLFWIAYIIFMYEYGQYFMYKKYTSGNQPYISTIIFFPWPVRFIST